MSIKDLNKVVILSSGLTGDVVLQIDFEDVVNSRCGEDYLDSKIYDLISNEQGCIIRVGYKNQ